MSRRGKLEDNDGIDGPFERRMAARARSCPSRWGAYRCGKSPGHAGDHATGGDMTTWHDAAADNPKALRVSAAGRELLVRATAGEDLKISLDLTVMLDKRQAQGMARSILALMKVGALARGPQGGLVVTPAGRAEAQRTPRGRS